MNQSVVIIVVFVAMLVSLPWALKWLQQRQGSMFRTAEGVSQIVSSMVIAPQQRVITVEVGPPTQRVWLVLGVTGQSIQCLHVFDHPPAAPPVDAPSVTAGSAPAPARRSFKGIFGG